MAERLDPARPVVLPSPPASSQHSSAFVATTSEPAEWCQPPGYLDRPGVGVPPHAGAPRKHGRRAFRCPPAGASLCAITPFGLPLLLWCNGVIGPLPRVAALLPPRGCARA